MATNITSDNFGEYFNDALTRQGADAINDDAATGGIGEIGKDSIENDFLMLLLDKTTGNEVWKKAKLAEIAKKIDALTSLLHNAEVVQSLPAASAETVGRIYLVPASLMSTALWDWANGVPITLRDTVVAGIDQRGILPSDNRLHNVGIGPAEAGNDVLCRVMQVEDTFVTIGGGVAITIPVAIAGDVVEVKFADNTAENCLFEGSTLTGEAFTHTITAAEAAAGYITLITADSIKITSIAATYLAGNMAQGFDPQHTQCDKYVTIPDNASGTTEYRWEQIGSAYINMEEYYTRQEIKNLLTGITDSLKRYVDEHTAGSEIIETSADMVALLPNKLYKWVSPMDSITATFVTGYSGTTNHYMLEFTCPSETGTALTLPQGVRWMDGNVLEPEPKMTYQVSILDNLAVYAGWEAADV